MAYIFYLGISHLMGTICGNYIVLACRLSILPFEHEKANIQVITTAEKLVADSTQLKRAYSDLNCRLFTVLALFLCQL